MPTHAETAAMSNLAFDTLAYVKKLRTAGVPDQQAEAHAEAIADVVGEKLATKQDIFILKQDLVTLESRLESRIVLKLGAIVIGSAAILGIVLSILEFTVN